MKPKIHNLKVKLGRLELCPAFKSRSVIMASVRLRCLKNAAVAREANACYSIEQLSLTWVRNQVPLVAELVHEVLELVADKSLRACLSKKNSLIFLE